MIPTVAAQIRSLRKKSGITQEQLADELKITKSCLCHIEAGRTLPSTRILKRFEKHFKMDSWPILISSNYLPASIQKRFRNNPNDLNDFCELLDKWRPAESKSAPKFRHYTLIDLFSGAGGFTRGFHDTGRFQTLLANDIHPKMAQAYSNNFGPHATAGDINDLLAGRKILKEDNGTWKKSRVTIPKADVVIGGPPCQGFSLLNKKRVEDSRKQLWRPFMSVVRRSGAWAFVMENVPELLKSHEYNEIEKTAKKLGFKVISKKVLNAADFGVPQRRKRAIIIGIKGFAPGLPRETHADPRKIARIRDEGKKKIRPWATLRDFIGDLKRPKGTAIRKESSPSDLHFGRNPTALSLERYKVVNKQGDNRFTLQNKRPDITPPCWIRKTAGGTDLFGRLWWNRPAFTIRTEFYKPEKGRHLHPSQHRPLTHREAARLQSFEDDFKFFGSKTEIAIQIGNAVPPLLARHIANHLLLQLDTAKLLKKTNRAAN